VNRFVPLLACCASMLLAPAAAEAIAPQEAIRLLNMQRAANGIPGDLVLSPSLSEGCSKHNNYIQANGGSLVHGEDPGKPGYTPEGAGQTLDSGGAEALSRLLQWSDTTNPWTLAPLQQYLVFDPEAAVAGYSDDHAIACARLRGGRAPATAPQFHSLPGSGRTGVPTSELNRDDPYLPQQLVDVPGGIVTGPNILLYTRGLRGSLPLRASSFSIAGPQGPVEARLVTEGTTNAIGSGASFRGGGVLVPIAPLRPFADYVVRVVWHRDADGALPATDAEQVVAFETAPLANPIDVTIRSERDTSVIAVSSPAPNPTLVVSGPGERVANRPLTAGSIRYKGLEPGPWTACATSGGKPVGYVQASVCKPFTAFGSVALKIARRRGRKSAVMTVPRIVSQRIARVTITRSRRSCPRGSGGRGCTRRPVGRADRFRVLLKSPVTSLPLPRRRPGIRLSARVMLPGFKVGQGSYLPTDVRRSWG